MAHIHRVQDLFDEYGIVPCYVIDYPIASQPEGRESLSEAEAVAYFQQAATGE